MSDILSVTLGQHSISGVKQENEDFLGAYVPEGIQLENKGVAVAIADGMSGSDGGMEASRVSINQFITDYYDTPESWTVKQAVCKIMTALNTWLYSQGQERYNSAKGLVTTFSALVIKSQTAHIFHVGDCRIYRYREKELSLLTRDHRVWLSKDREYLSRALGIDTHLEISYQSMPVQSDDIYILSTDGVHDFVSDQQIHQIINSTSDVKKIAESIVDAAKNNDSDDNISCLLLRIDTLSKPDKLEFYEQLTQLPFPPDLQAGNILDGFKILRELNTSSRSQVYLAEDTHDEVKRKVVIKTPSLNYEDDASYIDLFLHEEWVAKRLNSPHLIKVCGLDRKREFLYTVVEYVHGQSLRQWMVDNPRPTLVQVRATVDQIARGLRTMHRMEMIHQDLKPENILLDKNKTLKIIDFGSTKIAGLAEIQSVLEHNQIVGTASYSAPEYFKGNQGSSVSDIYSLGVIAYEMITGRLPYGSISPERAGKKTFAYVSAKQYNPTVPDWVDACLQRATQANPEKRYQLLSEFVTDLSKPNQALLEQGASQPLIERNPLGFWRGLAFVQLLFIVYLLWLMLRV